MQTTKLIGITGGIGAGKSYFAELLTNALADHHISTESLSADAFVASLYEHDKQWRALVRARLGTDDKHEVAKLLFVESNNLTDKLFIELHAVARFIDYLEDRRLQSTASFIVV
jgi:deoxyadenosine/deoxycytidine kinase